MIHPTVVFYGKEHIKFGKNVRIDCYAVITAGPDGMEIGDNVHIGCYTAIFGSSGKVRLGNFSGFSPRCTVFTGTDDFTSGHLINPCVDDEFRNVKTGDVILEDHASVGTGALILPGVVLGRGSAVGAMAIVKKDVAPYDVVVGHDQRVVGKRNQNLMNKLEAAFLEKHG